MQKKWIGAAGVAVLLSWLISIDRAPCCSVERPHRLPLASHAGDLSAGPVGPVLQPPLAMHTARSGLTSNESVATGGTGVPEDFGEAEPLYPGLRPFDSDARRCLSLNVYWEARNQSMAGQIAVAQVTINRTLSARFPDDICEVVYDHKQFSWYWDGKSDTPLDSRAWQTSMLVASAALEGSGHAELEGVTHYHAVYSQPYWRSYMTQVTMIDDHVFYSD